MTDIERVRKARKILKTSRLAAEQLDDLLELLTGSRNTAVEGMREGAPVTG